MTLSDLETPRRLSGNSMRYLPPWLRRPSRRSRGYLRMGLTHRWDRWKPHIFRLGGEWVCLNDYFGGIGPTIQDAYAGFRAAMARR